ncbi:MAG: sulfite exporter TauE/SafE family protein [Nitrososphaera sp.]|jgi:hypothetical protein
MPIDLFTIIMLGSLGLAIGFVGGLLGLVLGVLRFPLILTTTGGAGATVAMVAGTNMGISTLGAMTAAIRHFRQNNVHLRIFAIMAATGAAGAFLGSMLTQHVPVTFLFVIIGLIVSYEAYSLITSSQKGKGEQKAASKPNLGVESSIGFGVGFLGGMVGLVLGSIRMPAMIGVLKMEPKVAIGTNLAASSIMGAAGLEGHLLNGNVDFLVLGLMGSTAMIGGYIGAKYTTRFSANALKLLIGVVLIFVAVIMFLKAAAIL